MAAAYFWTYLHTTDRFDYYGSRRRSFNARWQCVAFVPAAQIEAANCQSVTLLYRDENGNNSQYGEFQWKIPIGSPAP